MSTLIDRRGSRSTNGRTSTESNTPAERLRTTMAACRVQFTWYGTKKSLTVEQKAQAAETFDAEGQFLSAGKKLLDTKHTAYRAVTAKRLISAFSAISSSPEPATSNLTTAAGGSPTCLPSPARFSGRSPGAARPSRPNWSGS